jgi:hypothetical protein
MHLIGLLHDGTRADEANPRHQALQDIGLLVGILPREETLPEEHVHARADRHEWEDTQADIGLGLSLSFPP